MALYKRGNIWHYSFVFKGTHHQGSTYLTNRNLAVQFEAKKRSDLALEQVGIVPAKILPTLRVFAAGDFLQHVRSTTKPTTVRSYESRVRMLLKCDWLADAKLNEIDAKMIKRYGDERSLAKRQRRGEGQLSVAAVNRELAAIRYILNKAKEWNPKHPTLDPPSINLLPGELPCDFVVNGELETAYFDVVKYPLRHAAVLVLDLGLRPTEAVSLLKTDIFDIYVRIREGKSANAKRTVPLTSRARLHIEELFALWPDSPLLFPGLQKEKHLTVWALDHLHAELRKRYGWTTEFILYSFRHTFGTRLAESGANPHDIKKLMGHSSITVSERYIHPTPDHIIVAMRRKEALDKIIRGEDEKVATILPAGVAGDFGSR